MSGPVDQWKGEFYWPAGSFGGCGPPTQREFQALGSFTWKNKG